MSDHYFNDMTPTEFVEHMEKIFPEFGDLDVEGVLQQQRSAYLYIQENKNIKSDDNQTSNMSRFSAYVDESWWEDIEQLTLDEALARSLQDYSGDDSDETGHLVGTIEPPPPAPRVASRSRRYENIDPDNMTYEELQSLDEASGNEHKGLSEYLVSRLPTFRYKAGSSSSRKPEEKECVVCCSAYNEGDTLTTLPCAHQYHTDCINHWLKIKKNCPVCKKEVRED